jgi:hypothetical protein
MARKEKTIHYIYKTTCNVTGRWYIGMHSTCNLEDGYMGSGLILRRSIRKHGADNHTKEILEYLETRESLILREIEIINKELIGDGLCMNLKEGGEGGFSSEEHMMNCSKAGNEARKIKLDNDIEFRKRHVEYATINLSKVKNIRHDGMKGKTQSINSKKLMSESSKGQGIGEANSQYGTYWITNEIEVKKMNKNDKIPDGWILGRKIKK